MSFAPHFWTTHVGSLPHTDCSAICKRLSHNLDVPSWPQLPRRSFLENMYVQFSAGLPGLKLDVTKEKVYFNTRDDLSEALEGFYERYLADDLEAFALTADYAAGFYYLLDHLPRIHPYNKPSGRWAKGQVTGPVSFGLTVTDQDMKASLYNEQLADVIVKKIAMNARWQVRHLRSLRPNVIISVDEPYMAAFGSAFVSLSRQHVTGMLDEVFTAIHREGGLASVHCCANTDWSVLLSTKVDVLNLDAFGYIENLALYPHELRTFIDRGGAFSWGIVPNNEEIMNTTPRELVVRLRKGINLIVQKAHQRGVSIEPCEFNTRSMIAPSCGLGSTSVKVAEKVIDVLMETGTYLKQGG